MKNTIVLIAGSNYTKEFLYNQIKEFIPDTYNIEAYASEESIKKNFKCSLLIISSNLMKKDLDKMNLNYCAQKTIVCKRSINFDYIDQITEIPLNEEVLLVNDEKDNSEELIKNLIELGLTHIKYHPYFPGIDNYKKLKLAITPGEVDKIPSCVENVINIGPRIIDITSIYEIINAIDIDIKNSNFILNRYTQKIINISKKISSMNKNIHILNEYLNNIVGNLLNGILVIDNNGYIKYANEEMRKILSLDKNFEKKNIRAFLDRENITYFLSTDLFENKEINILGIFYKITKIRIPKSNNIIITTNKENIIDKKNSFSQNLVLKGHYAKYNIENIIGDSPLLNDAKKTALKLSKTDLTVLIEGESGTGKELFASTIHNNSNRKHGPFLAINFSALPDELIESELFGYEEGAFTGAKKGGKVGLFELANGGTIFLDEIGDVSLKVQTKLLRILQEKEIMPIGGSIIRKVDVRIITATNKNLKEMVKNKEFRSDLFYRLKIGYLNIPPLCKRLNDIEKLIYFFIQREGINLVQVSKDVIEKFKSYKWPGNVRELESTIKYMMAVRDSHILTLDDLPDKNFFEDEIYDTFSETNRDEHLKSNNNFHQNYDYNISSNIDYELLSEDLKLILITIKDITDSGAYVGREKISQILSENGCNLTPSQIRTKLNILQNKGFVEKSKGKRGTFLTQKSLMALSSC